MIYGIYQVQLFNSHKQFSSHIQYKRMASNSPPPLFAAKQHRDLSNYLALELTSKDAKMISLQRKNAREKLGRLTKAQYHELSTDVYDEMCRRQRENVQDGKDPLIVVSGL